MELEDALKRQKGKCSELKHALENQEAEHKEAMIAASAYAEQQLDEQISKTRQSQRELKKLQAQLSELHWSKVNRVFGEVNPVSPYPKK